MSESVQKIGVVVIGRNEGERLKRCLRSLHERAEHIVYVDSGSTDGSVEFARSLGADVVELDMSKPFTMARGRNAGFARLVETRPETAYVQFVDGDCEVARGWIEIAVRTLDERPDVVAVAGRRRERFPDASLYNRLCDMEWDGPTGEVRYTGGDVMMRTAALRQVGGFRESMIAGEEPELGVRLRRAGGKILRLTEEMTLHDAAMTRFSQWWKRAVRSGHAYAEGAAIHGRSPERHNVRQLRSTLFWAALAPFLLIASLLAALSWMPWAWLIVAIVVAGYVRLLWRIDRQRRAHGDDARSARMYALFCVLGKWPQLVGIITYYANRWLGKNARIMEYKLLDASAGPASA
jgi:GT2 family glycosyltransferase